MSIISHLLFEATEDSPQKDLSILIAEIQSWCVDEEGICTVCPLCQEAELRIQNYQLSFAMEDLAQIVLSKSWTDANAILILMRDIEKQFDELEQQKTS